jgi:hypothetical protein
LTLGWYDAIPLGLKNRMGPGLKCPLSLSKSPEMQKRQRDGAFQDAGAANGNDFVPGVVIPSSGKLQD